MSLASAIPQWSAAPPDANATRALAEFVVGTEYASLPAPVVEHIRRLTMDTLAVSIGAAADPSVGILSDYVDLLGGDPQATVWGTGKRVNLEQAALVNGHLANLLTYGDTYWSEPTTVHVCPAVLPPVLALGEWLHASGADCALAIAVGYEAEVHVAMSAGWTHHRRAWHVSGTMGSFGAAAAAGKMLGLSVDQMVHAFGIAGSQAAGTIEPLGSMTMGLLTGIAARSGVQAALLARAGFTSASDILTGKYGFHAVFQSDQNIDALFDGLGTRWELPKARFKPFGCGSNLFAVIEAAITLRNDHGVRAEDVEVLEAHIDPHVLVPTGKGEGDLKSGMDGKFSVPHATAVALIDGAAGPAQFTDARLRDPEVASLRERVRPLADDSVTRTEARLVARLTDGRVIECHVPHAPGVTAENPMTEQQLVVKFRSLVEPALGVERANQILSSVGRLEQLDDIAELTKQLG